MLFRSVGCDHTTSPIGQPLYLRTLLSQNLSFLRLGGTTDETNQLKLSKTFGFKYRAAIGELIFALVTCRPDLSYGVVRCAQHSVAPHDIHYHAVRHMLKYLYVTRDDGIYFWRTTLNESLPPTILPTPRVSEDPTILSKRPHHSPMDVHGYVDSDWATCPRTRRSLTGICVRLAGGTIAYKTKLQSTIAQSSTEAEFMGASDFGKLILYIRSILWDLGLPQQAASILYEDNDACTNMAMANKQIGRAHV